MVATVTSTDFDTDALLAGMAGKSTAKTKGKPAKPILSDPKMEAEVLRWIEADQKAKEWDSIRVTAEAQILAYASPARLPACRRMGKNESTFLINGRLAMTQKCQYSDVPIESLLDLQVAFGEDAGRYFIEKMELSLTPAAVADRGVIKTLVAALGPEKFAECFTVKKTVAVTETFHADFTLKPEVEETAREFIEQGIIKPFKASLKLA